MAKISFFRKMLYAIVLGLFFFLIIGIFSVLKIDFFSADAFSGAGLFILIAIVLGEILIITFGA